MTDAPISVRSAEPEDIDRVVALLGRNDLPHRDVRAKSESFFVATDGTELVGAGGVELYGPDGLLRSVVVADPHRGKGYGTLLTDSLETHARTNGVEWLYLLTTTASEFFRQRGYETIPREQAPPSIRGTTEFADLCPMSATCLQKRLDSP